MPEPSMQLARTIADHPLVARLQSAFELTDEETRAIREVSFQTASYSAGEVILRTGDRPSRSILVLEGIVSNSKVLPDGKRQIMALYVPGDMPLQMMHPSWGLSVDVCAVGPCTLACFDADEVWAICQRLPRLAWLLWELALVTASILREWIVNVGHRPAVSRIAHLFCEMFTRLEAAGLARDGACELPMTQEQLSQTTGLSRIHVNRSLQKLRQLGLIRFEFNLLTILDRKGLEEVGQFSPDYLFPAPPVQGSAQPD